MAAARFYCPTCNCAHVLNETPHRLENIAPDGELISLLVRDYLLHADQRISLEEPASK